MLRRARLTCVHLVHLYSSILCRSTTITPSTTLILAVMTAYLNTLVAIVNGR